MNKTLIVVVGPTAVGKTDFTIRLAKEFSTDIVSADSRQFYKELSIGTAKPSPEEMQGVKHYFIDSHSIFNPLTAGEFEEEALELLNQLFLRKDVIILTGGSGLFIRAVCEGMDEFPDIDPSIREQLNKELQEKGLEYLTQELSQKDPEYAAIVDLQNPQRVIRALEVIRGTGYPYSSFRTNSKKNRAFNIVKIGLERDREELYERINKRVDLMLEQGLLKEAKQYYEYKDLNALQTVGYSEIYDFMDGKYDWEEAVRLIKRNTRRYAKRQLTWFKKDKDIVWFSTGNEAEIIRYVRSQLENKK
ncbi:MAG TPA: tRNA (adenosine(37)-N6)-dimethylallyltransferase MiaA [Cytophagaceae bacterium]